MNYLFLPVRHVAPPSAPVWEDLATYSPALHDPSQKGAVPDQ